MAACSHGVQGQSRAASSIKRSSRPRPLPPPKTPPKRKGQVRSQPPARTAHPSAVPKRAGACRGHGGVQSWGAAEATTIPMNAPAQLATPAPATSRRTTPAPASNGQVWVNTDSRVYHSPGTRWHGKTKEGIYMSETQAQARGPSRTTERLAPRKRISGENLAHITGGAAGLPSRPCHQATLRTVAWRADCGSASQQASDIRTASRSNRMAPRPYTSHAAITRSAAMTDLDPGKKEEDPKELRSAAVDALQKAARQSDPQEFNRLTRHALALIERARAIGHGRQTAVWEATEPQILQKDDAGRPGLSHKIIKFIVRLWRRSA